MPSTSANAAPRYRGSNETKRRFPVRAKRRIIIIILIIIIIIVIIIFNRVSGTVIRKEEKNVFQVPRSS